MAERYQIISHSEDRMYQNDCPVICSAYNILYDNLTEDLLLQAKFENLSRKILSEVNISVDCYDVANNSISSDFDIGYLGISVPVRKTFGAEIVKNLPDSKTRRIVIKVNSIVFADGSIWNYDGLSKMEKIPTQQFAENFFNNKGFSDEFDALTPTVHKKRKMPIFNESYWLCTCGEINLSREDHCSSCKLQKETLQKIIDKDFLAKSAEERREKQEEEAKRQSEIKAQMAKKTKKFILSVVIVAVIAFVGYFGVSYFTTADQYKAAQSFIDVGNYEEALKVLDVLGNNNKTAEMKISAVDKMISDGDYKFAYETLTEMSEYANVDKEIDNCVYKWIEYVVEVRTSGSMILFTSTVDLNERQYDYYYDVIMEEFEPILNKKVTEDNYWSLHLEAFDYKYFLNELPADYKDVSSIKKYLTKTFDV